MNLKLLLSTLPAAAAIFCAACQKSSCPGEEAAYPVVTPYDNAKVQKPLSMAATVKANDVYGIQRVELDRSALSKAFGGTLPSDMVMYAHMNDKRDVYGEDWYTSENGFYFDSHGMLCSSGHDDAHICVEYYPATLSLGIGQAPESCKAGEKYTVEFGFATPETKQPVTLEVTIRDAGEWAKSVEHSDGLTYSIYETVNVDYKALEIAVNETAVKEALGLSSLQPFLDAMQSDTAYNDHMIGINADGSQDTYDKYTANVAGYWFNTSGDVCEWKDENWGAFVEWDRNSPMIFRVGQNNVGLAAGTAFDMRIALAYEGKTALLTFKLHIVDEVTDDMGADE